jgi:hypothetical protein
MVEVVLRLITQQEHPGALQEQRGVGILVVERRTQVIDDAGLVAVGRCPVVLYRLPD